MDSSANIKKKEKVQVQPTPEEDPEKKRKKEEKAREKQLKKGKFLQKQAQQQAQQSSNASTSKKSEKKVVKRGGEGENPEDYVDPDTPSGEKKRMARQMAKQYSPTTVEKSWYEWWEESRYFVADANSSKITIHYYHYHRHLHCHHYNYHYIVVATIITFISVVATTTALSPLIPPLTPSSLL